MKKNILFLFFISLLTHGKSQKLLVTELTFNYISNRNFDPYLENYFENDKLNFQRLKQRLDSALLVNHQIQEVDYTKTLIKFWGNSFEESFEFEPYVNHHKKLIKKGGYDYYLKSDAEISVNLQTESKTVYMFQLNTKISDGRGKKFFKQVVKIPFTISFPENGIGDQNLISPYNFYNSLYFKAIEKALVNEKTDFEVEDFKRAITESYDNFLDSAGDYYLISKYQSRSALFQDSIKIKVKRGWEGEDKSDGLLSNKKKISQKITLKNDLSKEDWKTIISSESAKLLGFLETGGYDADIIIKLESNEKTNFQFNNNELAGKIAGNSYDLIYNENSSLMKIFIDSELAVLIQPKGNSKSTELRFYLAKDQLQHLKVLLNLRQLYFETIRIIDEAKQED